MRPVSATYHDNCSPYFVGTKLWNALQSGVIELPDIYTFKTSIKKVNRTYIDML